MKSWIAEHARVVATTGLVVLVAWIGLALAWPDMPGSLLGVVTVLLLAGTAYAFNAWLAEPASDPDDEPDEEISTFDEPQPDEQIARFDLDSGVEQAVYAADSHHLAALGQGGEIDWQTRDGTTSRRLLEHNASGLERKIAWSPDGEWLAVASPDGSVELREPESDDVVARREFGVDINSLVVLDAETRDVAFGDDRGRVLIGELDDDSPPTVLDEHTDAVDHLVWMPQLEQLVSGGRDGTVRCWHEAGEDVEVCWDSPLHRLDDDLRLEALEGAGGRIAVRLLHRDEREPDEGSEMQTIRVWDLDRREERLCLTGEPVETTRDIALDTEGQHVALSQAERLRIVEVDSGEVALEAAWPVRDTIRAFDLSPSGEAVVTGSEQGQVRIWGLEALRHGREASLPGARADDSDDAESTETQPSSPSPLASTGSRGREAGANGEHSPLEPRSRRVVGTDDTLTSLRVYPWWPRSTSRKDFCLYPLLALRDDMTTYRQRLEKLLRRAADRLQTRQAKIDELDSSLDQTQNRSDNISTDASAIDEGDVGQALETREALEQEVSSDVGGRAENIRELTSQLQNHRRHLQKLETFVVSAIELYRAATVRLVQREVQARWAIHVEALTRRLEALSTEALDHEADDGARADRLETWSELLSGAADFIERRGEDLDTRSKERIDQYLRDVSTLDELLTPLMDDQTLATESEEGDRLVGDSVREADRQVLETRRESYLPLYEALVDTLRGRAETLADSASGLRGEAADASDEGESDEANASDEQKGDETGDDGAFGATDFGESERDEHRKPDMTLELEVADSGFESGGTQLIAQYGRSGGLDATGEGPSSYSEALERIAERVYRADPVDLKGENPDERPELELVEALVAGDEVERLELHDWTGRVQRLVASWIS